MWRVVVKLFFGAVFLKIKNVKAAAAGPLQLRRYSKSELFVPKIEEYPEENEKIEDEKLDLRGSSLYKRGALYVDSCESPNLGKSSSGSTTTAGNKI